MLCDFLINLQLRKVSKNRIALEINGWWARILQNSYDNKYLLSASSKSVVKEATFEIGSQPNQWQNIRISASNEHFLQLEKVPNSLTNWEILFPRGPKSTGTLYLFNYGYLTKSMAKKQYCRKNQHIKLCALIIDF